jgi:hypothetical protein
MVVLAVEIVDEQHPHTPGTGFGLCHGAYMLTSGIGHYQERRDHQG